MTQEEKILLLKDICARIPYGLKASVRGSIEENITFDILSVATNFRVFVENRFISVSHYEDIEVVRPYLRPMSSMTEKEKQEFYDICTTLAADKNHFIMEGCIDSNYMLEKFNWLNAHYFDYRGLIEKGLALEASEYMYNNKKG